MNLGKHSGPKAEILIQHLISWIWPNTSVWHTNYTSNIWMSCQHLEVEKFMFSLDFFLLVKKKMTKYCSPRSYLYMAGINCRFEVTVACLLHVLWRQDLCLGEWSSLCFSSWGKSNWMWLSPLFCFRKSPVSFPWVILFLGRSILNMKIVVTWSERFRKKIAFQNLDFSFPPLLFAQ